jgi:hypothetical protein
LLTFEIQIQKLLALLTVKRKTKGEKLNVEDLELAMAEEYRQNFRNNMNTSTSKGKILLLNQGLCYNCGKPGH